MSKYELLKIYSAYLYYKTKTNNGILWGISNDLKVLTKLEDGKIVENNIDDIKLFLNPIEMMVEKVDSYEVRDIPIIVAARASINDAFLYDVEIKSTVDERVGFGCAIKFRDCRDVIRILIYSEKFKFSLEEVAKDGNLENRKTVDCRNQYLMYQILYGLHMNMFSSNVKQSGLTSDDYLIKENINPDEVYNPFLSPD